MTGAGLGPTRLSAGQSLAGGHSLKATSPPGDVYGISYTQHSSGTRRTPNCHATSHPSLASRFRVSTRGRRLTGLSLPPSPGPFGNWRLINNEENITIFAEGGMKGSRTAE